MKRRLFNLAAAVSLVICAATVVLWIRGSWQCDSINWASENYGGAVASANSVMVVMFGPNYSGPDAMPIGESGLRGLQYRHSPARTPAGQDQVSCQIPIAKYHRLGWLGFAYDPNQLVTVTFPRKIAYYSSHRVYFPHWALTAVAGTLPVIWVWQRWRQRSRAKVGHCPTCGYDLRATPERCPECGTAVAPKPTEAAA
jgi:hypothetical protein